MKKIAVVGAGAMGSVWAVNLALAGNEVTVVDVAPHLIETITSQGIAVEHAGTTARAYPTATSQPARLAPVEVAFFFVKAQHTASAATVAAPLIGPTTTVVSLQNGWGNADVLAQHVAPQRIVVGVTYHSATVIAPAQVAHTGKGATYLGPYHDEAGLDRAIQVGQLLSEVGIACSVTEQVKTEIWKKLILNAATLPTSALTGLCAGDLGQPGEMLDLVDAVALEAVRVAQALGYTIDASERIECIHAVLTGAGKGKSSMLQDAQARRKTEIEVINGAVVREAERLGLDVALNRAMVALVHGLERGWQQ